MSRKFNKTLNDPTPVLKLEPLCPAFNLSRIHVSHNVRETSSLTLLNCNVSFYLQYTPKIKFTANLE